MPWDDDNYPRVPWVVDHVLANEDSRLDSLSKANFVG
jgi:hypothetical protein